MKHMLVRDLIAKLQQLDPNLPVVAVPAGWDQWNFASEVRELNIVRVCDEDHPAPFAGGGKPQGDWFKAVEIRSR